MRHKPTTAGASLDEVRDDWKRAYIATANALDALRAVHFGHTDDAGIQKYALMVQANLHHALGDLSHVCAKSIRLEAKEAANG